MRPSPDVLWRELDGETVLLELASGRYYGLNEVATRIWQLLDQGFSPDRIAGAIAAEYEADPAAVRADVLQLMDELRARKLVSTDPEP